MGTQAQGMINNAFVAPLAPEEAERKSATQLDIFVIFFFQEHQFIGTCVVCESSQQGSHSSGGSGKSE